MGGREAPIAMTSSMSQPATAVLLLAHGTPNTLGEMADYLSHVVGGRPMPAQVVVELQHRYAEIGLHGEPGPEPPPLTKWTIAQGKLLETALAKGGRPLPVYIAMRNWHPFIADVVAQMRADGIARILAICLAPQNSRTSTGLYRRALMAAVESSAAPGGAKLEVTFVDAWPEEPALIEAFAERLAETYPRACDEAARTEKAAGKGTALPILFTAHSVPERTVAATFAKEGTPAQPADPYADQARRTAALVFARATELLAEQNHSAPQEYVFAFQSQGVARGPDNSWLGPTVEETLATLAALATEGHRGVVLQPIGFLCDHVEVLYDIDIAFAETARSLNLRLFRVESLNDSPLLTAALVDVVDKHLAVP
jgi:protoporphyrin/coproporphyrin ferrochelatase